MKIAKKHNLIVIEDACQAWLAEYDHKKLGTFGHAGCFSFQNSKNIPMGEGGAIVSDDDAFMDRCFSYHNYGNPYGSEAGAFSAGAVRIGTKLRLTEYQAAIGLVQLKRLEEETEQRNQNAALLRKAIDNIPGILPYRLYEKANRASFHLFPFRFKKEAFKGLERNKFLAALQAEGVPCSSGYRPLNKMPFLKNTLESKYYKKFYPSKKLNYNNYADTNQCPLNDQLCEEAVWIPQNILLGSTADMEQIAMAIKKIYDHAEDLR
jgi:dTDP-4-amino-4,6-dideoxygalactose transaminase